MSIRLEPEAYELLKLVVFERDFWKCRFCGWRRIEAHHIDFRSQGGADISSNICTLCSACHSGVHSGHLSIYSADPNVGADGPLEFIAAQGWQPGR